MREIKTIREITIDKINESIKEDVTIFYGIMGELGLDMLQLSEMLCAEKLPIPEFAVLYGAYKKVVENKKKEALEKTMTL